MREASAGLKNVMKASPKARLIGCLLLAAGFGALLCVAILTGDALYIINPARLKETLWIDSSYGSRYWLSLGVIVAAFVASVHQVYKDVVQAMKKKNR